ncbi:MAG TPA: biotin--[acetyl-CoA-carboxylase] ligase [Thermomicrobiaceae bacterium]|nr:biotin--[acetyl-CoA-carboxylase] ligase [Thermomicrobiaceae bacterium]HEX5305915.1 biotin--[acetyl-CoA-carboxylase] ligase [Dyella sp.]
MRWQIEKHDTVGSTMDLAAGRAAAGAPAGLVVWAEQQSAGRGRLGRVWHSEPGTSLLVTLLLRPALAVVQDPELSRAIAAGVARAIRRVTGFEPEIKAPNDLMAGEAGRKLAGILCQTSLRGDEVDYLLVGIGLNVNLPAERLPLPTATSLLAETGREHNRDELLAAILAEVDAMPGLADD